MATKTAPKPAPAPETVEVKRVRRTLPRVDLSAFQADILPELPPREPKVDPQAAELLTQSWDRDEAFGYTLTAEQEVSVTALMRNTAAKLEMGLTVRRTELEDGNVYVAYQSRERRTRAGKSEE